MRLESYTKIDAFTVTKSGMVEFSAARNNRIFQLIVVEKLTANGAVTQAFLPYGMRYPKVFTVRVNVYPTQQFVVYIQDDEANVSLLNYMSYTDP